MLNIVQISFFLDPQKRSPERILRDWWTLTAGAEMVSRAGARVTVVQACATSAVLDWNGIVYHFVAPPAGHTSIRTAPAFADLMRELRADLFHVHGLGFAGDVLTLSKLCPRTPIFLQDHADRVPRLWRRRLRRRALAAAQGISFCALEQAEPFIGANLIDRRTRLFEIAEASSPFCPGDRQAARQITGLHGEPAVLWVGHLDANKDPLTVLAGISAATECFPDLQLWCCYGSAPLMPEVARRIHEDPRLRGRVHLLGKLLHARIEAHMRAADFFVLGSLREGSGISVIEALACGLPPVVTQIPSFRMLTDDGRIGALWRCRDSAACARALRQAAAQPWPAARAAARAHFDRHLSFEAVGGKFVAAYAQMAQAAALGGR